MNIIDLTNEYKDDVERIVAATYSDEMIIAVHRSIYNLRELPCIIALSDKLEILGYCYYRISNDECEIMAIESMQSNIGVGTALIAKVKELSKVRSCKRLYLTTTNDNIHALRFYQRQGFTLCAVRLNELDYSRALNPAIPLIGDNDIPALHEIEFEVML